MASIEMALTLKVTIALDLICLGKINLGSILLDLTAGVTQIPQGGSPMLDSMMTAWVEMVRSSM